MMTVDQLRQAYLDFFKSKAHKLFTSDSLVPHDDPSLLFTGAGMNQFKPYFLGLKKDLKRATSCQKCLRTGDLERVGKTAYHHSFFEMLGNFSFGDYFKEEAIAYGWEFVTQVLKIPQDMLWVSVFENDDEAFNIWKDKIRIPVERIVRMDAVDNFWPSNAPKDGPNGPCGPCSEIYVGKIPGKGVEIWNLVFTQFDRQSDGSLKPLPQKNIDTGMGLERAAAVMQGVENNFQIDLFQNIRKDLKTLLKSGSNETAHENAAMDHIRAVVFSIADGALPSNEGRGYVIRKLIRLGSDHLDKAGALQPGSFHKLVGAVVRVMGSVYPEIVERQKTITAVIENEERSFQEVLRSQLPKLKEELLGLQSMKNGAEKSTAIAATAFKYYDTFGLPFEMIVASAEQAGLLVDQEQFDRMLEDQKKRSREKSKISGEIFSKTNLYSHIEGLKPTEFLGYDSLLTRGAQVQRLISLDAVVSEIGVGQEGVMICDRSPFYAESGGQVGDAGTIEAAGFRAEVLDTQNLEKCIGHKIRVVSGRISVGASVDLVVDPDRRADIMKNHTATHLLHSALRKTLGDHVKQSGSLVSNDYLRFDFTHFSGLDAATIARVEDLVNEEIQKSTTLEKRVMTKDEATQRGAIAFFGEKYGDQVRVVTIGDFSMELCGGTHLHNTGEIGTFKIVSEGSIQAGVRRIEAVTGRAASAYADQQAREIEALCLSFGAAPETLPQDLVRSGEKVSALKNRLTQIAGGKIRAAMISSVVPDSTISVVVHRMDGADVDLFRQAAEGLKSTGKSFVAMFYSGNEDKVSIVVAASADLVQKGLNAGKIVKDISGIVGGNGGGKPDFAVGGGKILAKLDDAIQHGQSQIQQALAVSSSGGKA